jgi:hypothetical protein
MELKQKKQYSTMSKKSENYTLLWRGETKDYGKGKQKIQGYHFNFSFGQNGHLPLKRKGAHTATTVI